MTSSRHSSPAQEVRSVIGGVVRGSSDNEFYVTPTSYNTPTSPPQKVTPIMLSATTNPSPLNTSTSVYTTPTTISFTDGIFTVTTPNPFLSFPTTSTVTTSTCTLSTSTSTTSTLTILNTIIHSTPNTSLTHNSSPKQKTRVPLDQANFDDILSVDKIITLNSPRPKRQSSPNLMGTLVSPPPTTSANIPKFESAYARPPTTLYPEVLVNIPSDSELSAKSQYVSVKRKRKNISNSNPRRTTPPTPPPSKKPQQTTNKNNQQQKLSRPPKTRIYSLNLGI